MSYMVARRTGEIGLRMSLGGRRERVLWIIMRQVTILAMIAVASGFPAALGESKLVESLLYGIKAGDALSMVTAVATMAMAAFAAGYLPARRASRIDPVVA